MIDTACGFAAFTRGRPRAGVALLGRTACAPAIGDALRRPRAASSRPDGARCSPHAELFALRDGERAAGGDRRGDPRSGRGAAEQRPSLRPRPRASTIAGHDDACVSISRPPRKATARNRAAADQRRPPDLHRPVRRCCRDRRCAPAPVSVARGRSLGPHRRLCAPIARAGSTCGCAAPAPIAEPALVGGVHSRRERGGGADGHVVDRGPARQLQPPARRAARGGGVGVAGGHAEPVVALLGGAVRISLRRRPARAERRAAASRRAARVRCCGCAMRCRGRSTSSRSRR